jgi:hypothetical protein
MIWGLYHKTSRIRNLRQMVRFRSKLEASHLSITNTQAWTNTLAYYGIQKLRIRKIFTVQAPEPSN